MVENKFDDLANMLGFEKKESPAKRKVSDDFDVQDGQAR